MSRVLWLDPDRFDLKPNKSPWLEMSRALSKRGYSVVLVTGYGLKPYKLHDSALNIISLSAIDIAFIFRISLMVHMLVWVILNAKKDDIFMLNPVTLFLSPVLRVLGYKNLHLDIRTLPLWANQTLKAKIDHFMFWKVPIRLFHRCVKGYSFITNRLRIAVEEEFGLRFSNYVIWQSGVNTGIFRPIDINRRDTADSRYRIFYHGSIYGNRGVDKIIEALSLLRPSYKEHIFLHIVGPVSGNLDIEGMVAANKLGDSVNIEGLVPYEMIPEKIAHADCCICPLPDLIEWNVSSPLKVFEYLACGKPVILTPIPAHKDVADGLDFIVWSNGYHAEAIRDAIEYAYDNKDILAIAANKAPGYIKSQYDWDVQGQKLSEYLIQNMSARSE